MKRYIGSFSLTLLIYLVFGFTFFYVFANDKIIIKEPEQTRTISLNHIELKPQKKAIEIPKPVREEKVVKKEIEKKIPKENKKVEVKTKAKTEARKVLKKEVKKVSEKEIVKQVIDKKEEETIPKEIVAAVTPIINEQKTPLIPPVKVDERKEYLSKHLAQIRSLINQNVNYPKRAKKLSIQGIVTARFKILENGTIENITIVNGHKYLQKATIEAIENASKYFPKVSKSIEIQIPIEYKLI